MPDAVLAPLTSPPAFALGLALLGAALARAGVLSWLSARPVLVLAMGVLAGAALRLTSLPSVGPDAVREAARLGLALLAFAAAQACAPSRAGRASAPALRLAVLAGPGLALVTAAAVFALLPALGPWSALLVGACLPLGVGAFDEGAAMAAPLPDATKRAVRVDAALGVAFGVPIAVLVEAVSVAPPAGADPTQAAGFAQLAGAAFGGTIGLLAGRALPVRRAGLPRAPFGVFALAYGSAYLLGFDAVMAGAACGLLHSEEARLTGPMRSRLFSAGARWCAPFGVFALGLLLGPVALQADLLVWLAALVPVLALRVALRGAALGGAELPAADKAFLSWFGGVPGAGAALFVVSLLGSPSPAAQGGALAVAALSVMAGLTYARLASGPLVTRQVRAAARARRKRYGAA